MMTNERPSLTTRSDTSLRRTPGAMTAHMRAVSPPIGPRVLRVAILVGGRIVEERVLEARQPVTVGASERCTFVLAQAPARRTVLFEPAGDGWKLRVTDGMTGRVAMGQSMVELAVLQRGAPLVLTEDARGRVSVGDTTFLFQVAPPLPAALRPRLPLSVKQGLGGQIDWRLTVLVALSFLMHFGLVGGMYSDWMDPTVDTELTARLALVPTPNTPPPPVETVDDAAASAAPSSSTPEVASTSKPTPRPPHHDVHPAPSGPNIDALVREWERVNVVAVGSVVVGPNGRRILEHGAEGDMPDLTGIAKRSEGVDDHPIALGVPRDQGAIAHPGTDLPSLHPVDTPPVASTAGTVRPVVPFQMHEDPPRATAKIANFESVIRRDLEPRARQCYQHAVSQNPDIPDGSLVVVIQVGPSGEVSGASVASRTGLSPQVAACIQGAASRLVFDSPGPGGATGTVPFHFVKQ